MEEAYNMNLFEIEKIKIKEDKLENIVHPEIDLLDLPLSIISPERRDICQQNIEILKAQKGFEEVVSTAEKGNFGEMLTDIDMRSKGYERISDTCVTDMDQVGHKGIDGVFYNSETDTYAIVESKYGSSELGETQDGRQMSWEWIDARLDEAVGEKTADKIREQYDQNPQKVQLLVANVNGLDKVLYKNV